MKKRVEIPARKCKSCGVRTPQAAEVLLHFFILKEENKQNIKQIQKTIGPMTTKQNIKTPDTNTTLGLHAMGLQCEHKEKNSFLFCC